MGDAASVWTDGSHSTLHGVGGWAFIIKSSNKITEFSGTLRCGVSSTFMEVTAATNALKKLDQNSRVQLMTDSQCIRGLIESGTPPRPQRRTSELDLVYDDFFRQMRRHAAVSVVKVMAHSGLEGNERVNQLARQAMARGLMLQALPVSNRMLREGIAPEKNLP